MIYSLLAFKKIRFAVPKKYYFMSLDMSIHIMHMHKQKNNSPLSKNLWNIFSIWLSIDLWHGNKEATLFALSSLLAPTGTDYWLVGKEIPLLLLEILNDVQRSTETMVHKTYICKYWRWLCKKNLVFNFVIFLNFKN